MNASAIEGTYESDLMQGFSPAEERKLETYYRFGEHFGTSLRNFSKAEAPYFEERLSLLRSLLNHKKTIQKAVRHLHVLRFHRYVRIIQRTFRHFLARRNFCFCRAIRLYLLRTPPPTLSEPLDIDILLEVLMERYLLFREKYLKVRVKRQVAKEAAAALALQAAARKRQTGSFSFRSLGASSSSLGLPYGAFNRATPGSSGPSSPTLLSRTGTLSSLDPLDPDEDPLALANNTELLMLRTLFDGIWSCASIMKRERDRQARLSGSFHGRKDNSVESGKRMSVSYERLSQISAAAALIDGEMEEETPAEKEAHAAVMMIHRLYRRKLQDAFLEDCNKVIHVSIERAAILSRRAAMLRRNPHLAASGAFAAFESEEERRILQQNPLTNSVGAAESKYSTSRTSLAAATTQPDGGKTIAVQSASTKVYRLYPTPFILRRKSKEEDAGDRKGAQQTSYVSAFGPTPQVEERTLEVIQLPLPFWSVDVSAFPAIRLQRGVAEVRAQRAIEESLLPQASVGAVAAPTQASRSRSTTVAALASATSAARKLSSAAKKEDTEAETEESKAKRKRRASSIAGYEAAALRQLIGSGERKQSLIKGLRQMRKIRQQDLFLQHQAELSQNSGFEDDFRDDSASGAGSSAPSLVASPTGRLRRGSPGGKRSMEKFEFPESPSSGHGSDGQGHGGKDPGARALHSDRYPLPLSPTGGSARNLHGLVLPPQVSRTDGGADGGEGGEVLRSQLSFCSATSDGALGNDSPHPSHGARHDATSCGDDDDEDESTRQGEGLRRRTSERHGAFGGSFVRYGTKSVEQMRMENRKRTSEQRQQALQEFIYRNTKGVPTTLEEQREVVRRALEDPENSPEAQEWRLWEETVGSALLVPQPASEELKLAREAEQRKKLEQQAKEDEEFNRRQTGTTGQFYRQSIAAPFASPEAIVHNIVEERFRNQTPTAARPIGQLGTLVAAKLAATKFKSKLLARHHDSPARSGRRATIAMEMLKLQKNVRQRHRGSLAKEVTEGNPVVNGNDNVVDTLVDKIIHGRSEITSLVAKPIKLAESVSGQNKLRLLHPNSDEVEQPILELVVMPKRLTLEDVASTKEKAVLLEKEAGRQQKENEEKKKMAETHPEDGGANSRTPRRLKLKGPIALMLGSARSSRTDKKRPGSPRGPKAQGGGAPSISDLIRQKSAVTITVTEIIQSFGVALKRDLEDFGATVARTAAKSEEKLRDEVETLLADLSSTVDGMKELEAENSPGRRGRMAQQLTTKPGADVVPAVKSLPKNRPTSALSSSTVAARNGAASTPLLEAHSGSTGAKVQPGSGQRQYIRSLKSLSKPQPQQKKKGEGQPTPGDTAQPRSPRDRHDPGLAVDFFEFLDRKKPASFLP
jgi:hypothetical protein